MMSGESEPPDLSESIKLAFEAAKHLTTLNAGSIVVIGTFLSMIFPTDSQGILMVPLYIKLLLGAAFVGFGTSLMVSTFAMFTFRNALQTYLDSGNRNHFFRLLLGIVGVSLPFVLFSGGLICFGIAVLLNLFFAG